MMAASLQRCQVPGCGKFAVDRHHLLTKGAHKSRAEHPDNYLYVCRKHHDEYHMQGRETFMREHGMIDVLERAKKAVWK